MFKRIEKRRRRKEEDEELGLDGETKELLGMHDTDSEESDSSSGSGNDSENSGEDQEADELSDASAEENSEDGEDGDSNAESGEEEDEDEDEPPMSIAESLKNPIYIISLDPDVMACIACPGKLLKNAKMSEVHKGSQAHIRRYARYVELASLAHAKDDVRQLAREQNANSAPVRDQTQVGVSKRAQKRIEKQAAIKTRRAKAKVSKARVRAEKEGQTAAPSTPPDSPQLKKRKFNTENADREPDSSDVSPPQRTKTKLAKSQQNASEKVSKPLVTSDAPVIKGKHSLPRKGSDKAQSKLAVKRKRLVVS